MGKIYYIFSIILVASLVLVSCGKKKWAKTADVNLAQSTITNEVTIAGKQFVIDKLTIEFSEMGISGDRLQAESVNVKRSGITSIDFISDFTSNSEVFKIPQGTFDKMNLSVRIEGSADSSVFISGIYYLSNGNTHDVNISIDIESYVLLPVLDNDNSSTLLIEEDKARTLVLMIDPEILFAEVNPGLWNAAAVTNLNGSETIMVDKLNNESIYFAIMAGVPNSLVAKFE